MNLGLLSMTDAVIAQSCVLLKQKTAGQKVLTLQDFKTVI